MRVGAGPRRSRSYRSVRTAPVSQTARRRMFDDRNVGPYLSILRTL